MILFDKWIQLVSHSSINLKNVNWQVWRTRRLLFALSQVAIVQKCEKKPSKSSYWLLTDWRKFSREEGKCGGRGHKPSQGAVPVGEQGD